MIRAGAASVDITPTPGLAMSGFAARTRPAEGAHDPLTVRAVVVDDTALVVVDVIGMSADMSARIRDRCMLPSENVVISALHNHGGPVSMAGRLSIAADPAWLERLEDACVAVIDKAAKARRSAVLTAGFGADPGVARNRRHADGPVDSSLPVLRLRAVDGDMIAVVVSYTCHPVVLAADNLLWTADYPHFVREALEKAYPGAIAVFATGCVGDLNTGHSAHASISLTASPERSYAAASRIGERIAEAALTAPEHVSEGEVSARSQTVQLAFERREAESPESLARRWREEADVAEPARKALLRYWVEWAETIAPRTPELLSARVTLLDWSGCLIAAMPGEIFAETSLFLRSRLRGGALAMVLGFADDNPGYIPPASEYDYGGYEVDEAHRYYGQPASFASGCAERLANVLLLLDEQPRL